ncbi:MAG: hypothetical protein WBM34_11225 [Woeseiaceae bacterium]
MPWPLTRALLGLMSVALLAPSANANTDRVIEPLLRYAKYKNGEVIAEYVGDPSGPFAESFRQTPVATGQMQVDCSKLTEVGIVIEPYGVSSWIYGAKTKYHFRWSHSSALPVSVSRMQYRRNMRGGFMRNRIGLDEWLVNGVIELTIRVRDELVFRTDFKLNLCDANRYRNERPPSETFREADHDGLDEAGTN